MNSTRPKLTAGWRVSGSWNCILSAKPVCMCLFVCLPTLEAINNQWHAWYGMIQTLCDVVETNQWRQWEGSNQQGIACKTPIDNIVFCSLHVVKENEHYT